MASTRTMRVEAELPSANGKPGSPAPSMAAAASAEAYEKRRVERIRENMERMQKLGIVDLAHGLNSVSAAAAGSGRPGRIRRRPTLGPACASGTYPEATPARRSLRLQNVTTVNYSEGHARNEKDLDCVKSDKHLGSGTSNLIAEGAKEELYTEEHEKLLGTTENTWVLFVDGCGKDGRRIYDQINGKTCHQCRQKTLGHRTHCNKCQLVQGQFCGDCLYMRYGEHVLEAKNNPNWVCPVCRGICNCSLCRIKKGWNPTGPLYKRITKEGYKSVAHYLIQTRRAHVSSRDSNPKEFVLQKLTHQGPLVSSDNAQIVSLTVPSSEKTGAADNLETDFVSGEEPAMVNLEMKTDEEGNVSMPKTVTTTSPKKEKNAHLLDGYYKKKRRVAAVCNSDCIASRLRSRT